MTAKWNEHLTVINRLLKWRCILKEKKEVPKNANQKVCWSGFNEIWMDYFWSIYLWNLLLFDWNVIYLQAIEFCCYVTLMASSSHFFRVNSLVALIIHLMSSKMSYFYQFQLLSHIVPPGLNLMPEIRYKSFCTDKITCTQFAIAWWKLKEWHYNVT